jgi:hypothetical protein
MILQVLIYQGYSCFFNEIKTEHFSFFFRFLTARLKKVLKKQLRNNNASASSYPAGTICCGSGRDKM